MDLSEYPVVSGTSVGWVSQAEMAEIDRVMVDDLGIWLIQMMENAGRNLARVAIEVFAPSLVAVLAGTGGNGGGGMVAARHLANAGVEVVLTTSRSADGFAGVPARQRRILERMGVGSSTEPIPADLTIDALVGYSLQGAPRGRVAELIEVVGGTTGASGPVLALDTPSGLDVTTGLAPGLVVSADVTMTLALPKIGLRNAPQVGELLLADISVPPSVTAPYGLGAPNFAPSPILRLGP
jgi:NAD(P)H-hydrate epimerase